MRKFKYTNRCLKCGNHWCMVDFKYDNVWNVFHRHCAACGANWDEAPEDTISDPAPVNESDLDNRQLLNENKTD